jgi:hypothetical protein
MERMSAAFAPAVPANGATQWPAATSTERRSPPTRKSAYIKATENTHYQNGYVTQRYDGAYNAGLVRGATTSRSPTGRPARAASDAGTLPAGWTFWTS